MKWLVRNGALTTLYSVEPATLGHLLSDGDLVLDAPEGVAPGNCKLVNGALVDMGSEKLNANPFWRDLRAERNARLTACDWTQLPDYPGVNAAAWATYRTALRNVPENTSDPQSPTWPEEP